MSFRPTPGSLPFLLLRSLRQHALASFITIFSIAMASGLVMSIIAIRDQAYEAFTGGATAFDAVLGARGSKLQLVLNAVFQLETSPGNIPWSLYKQLANDRRVKLAVPMAVGDNYRGWRIVGTDPKLFTEGQAREGVKFELREGGRWFDVSRREAVIGDMAARATGLGVGDTFKPYHGLTFDESHQHDEEYVVVGVLRPTNTPSDRALWIPIEGIFRMGGHVLRGGGKDFQAKAGEAIPDDHKEVSAVLLKFRDETTGFQLDQLVNKQGRVATLAWPVGQVMAEVFDRLGWMIRLLTVLAALSAVVAAGTILASLTNTIEARRREFAIIRALGAPRRTVFAWVAMEGAMLGAIGALLGGVVCAALLAGAAEIIRAQTGLVLDLTRFHPVWAYVPPAITALGAVAGLLPAWRAYRTDVLTNLQPQT